MNDAPTTIELFAGAGCLALGMEMSGFKHIGLFEIDDDAVQTLKTNRPNWPVYKQDVTKLTEKSIKTIININEGELDLLTGGAPCQTFSYAGKRLGFEDTRGTLFYYYALFLKVLKPKMFLFENVKGLINHDSGRTFKVIKDVFEASGYTLTWEVMNSWNYNVPQKRERLIIVGIRNDLVDVIHFEFPKPYEYKPVLRDVLLDCPPSKGAKYSKKKEEIFKLIPQGGNWKDLPNDIAKEYMMASYYASGGKTGTLKRLHMDMPSPTIMTTPTQKKTERCHPLETRPLTIRESARIQTFSDTWEFIGSISSQYKQIGNAVPVNLSKAIGDEIFKSLYNSKYVRLEKC